MLFLLGRATSALLVACLLAPPVHELDTEGIDAAKLDAGLRARVGDEVDAWQIEIRATELRGTYEVTLLGPGRSEPEHRQVNLVGQTDEDRSRELASMLAVIIDLEPDEADGEPELEPEPQPDPVPESKPFIVPRATISLEGHVGMGPPREPDTDAGLGLGVGAWLLDDHLQPRVRATWSRSQGQDLRVDGLSIGAGLAGGVSLGHWWLGALALPVFKWTRGESVRPATVVGGGGELTALVQYRRPWLVVGLRTGVETTFRPLRIRGNNDVIAWGPLRWLLVLEVGLGLGRRAIARRSAR